jgi:aminomethyltransferase
MQTQTVPRKTALNSAHRALGGKMVDFAGWDMPVEYSGIIAEHLAVRQAAGLFDVSHMGEINIQGPQALELVQQVTCNDASHLAVGQAQYSALLTGQGTFVDDIIVHKFSDTEYFLCVNAGNREKDILHIQSQNQHDAEVTDVGDHYTKLALQGPLAQEILQPLSSASLSEIKRYWFAFGKVSGADCLIARTGYTGEDGFELYFAPEHSEQIWTAILEAGRPKGLIPTGLGARNTLRLEAGYALYGHEIDDTTTVWEARLGWICKMKKGDFTGREALAKQKESGLTCKLVGFEMRGRGIARDGYPVYCEGQETGRVTSGSPSPLSRKNIGMTYLPVTATAPGTKIQIGIRKSKVEAEVVALPFYKRS